MLKVIVRDLMEYVEIEESQISENTRPVFDLHLNSYDFICLIGKLEDDLGITISENELRKFVTLGDLDDYIQNKCFIDRH